MLDHTTVLVDVDECSEKSDFCHDNATCFDSDGSYECECKTGFSGDGYICSGMIHCYEQSC